MTLVKICGITRPQDAALAVREGADWLGLNFWPASKRGISAAQGQQIARAARAAAGDGEPAAGVERPRVVVAGVFVNQDPGDIARIAAEVGLDAVQLHGDETAADCARVADALAVGRGGSRVVIVKALALRGAGDAARIADYPGTYALVDAPSAGYGGSGHEADRALARAAVAAGEAAGKRIFLAGGLNPDNVAGAIADVAPAGVDVASGVESAPGIKDAARLRRFVAAVRHTEQAPDDAARARRARTSTIGEQT